MKNIKVTLLALVAVATTALVSCKKDKEETDFTTEREMSEHMAMAEGDFNDVGNIADEASSGDLASYKGGCATVTHDTTSSPKKITIDFGTVNCLCMDNKYRKGKIIVTYTGRYRDNGTVITTGFDGYFVNDNEIKGTRTVTNNGTNSQGHPVFSVAVNGTIVLAGGKGTVTHVASRTRTWTAGYNTLQIADDKYLISGTSTTTGPKGDVFTATIRKDLQVELSCSNIVGGIMDFVRTGSKTSAVSIDFGAGVCDKIAMLTLPNGTTHQILLR